jgi:hypothetical protein
MPAPVREPEPETAVVRVYTVGFVATAARYASHDQPSYDVS